MHLEADTKGNEVGSFNGECSRVLIVSSTLRPNNGRFPLSISSHEYVGLVLWYVHLLSKGQN